MKLFKQLLQISVLVSSLFLGLSGHTQAATTTKPLPVEQALEFNASFIRPKVVLLHWDIKPGYQLYADRIDIRFSPSVEAKYKIPKGKVKIEADNERVEMLTREVNIPVTLNTEVEQITMAVDYQGCAEDGYCYPPMHKTILLNLPTLTATLTSDMQNEGGSLYTLKSLLTDQNGVKDLLQSLPAPLMILFFVGLGLLLAFTPCVLPMIPILTSIIVGQKHTPGTRKAFMLSLTYVMGMAVTYGLAGMLTASLGGSIQVWLQNPTTIIITSTLLLILALSLFGLYELQFSRRWQNWVARWSARHKEGTYVGVFFMGVLSTLVVSPCVTAPLVGVLIYVGQTGNLLLGTAALFAMGIGMGIPLLLIGMSANHLLPKSGAWMKAVKELFGIFMVGMAFWLLSRILPVTATLVLFGLLFIATGLFTGFYLPRLIRFKTINLAIGLAFALFGILLMGYGISNSLVKPVHTETITSFKVVTSLSELNHELTIAKEKKQPVMLDFYASWCEPCLIMDKTVFNAEAVNQALNRFVKLRVDLSANSDSDRKLLKYYEVIAPPTVLFFNQRGNEAYDDRIIGGLDAKEFLMRLDTFKGKYCKSKTAQC